MCLAIIRYSEKITASIGEKVMPDRSNEATEKLSLGKQSEQIPQVLCEVAFPFHNALLDVWSTFIDHIPLFIGGLIIVLRIFVLANKVRFRLASFSLSNLIRYTVHTKPIIYRKRVVCHACFNVPCQLVLTHAARFLRGADKQLIYEGTRVSPEEPIRLFIDARSTPE